MPEITPQQPSQSPPAQSKQPETSAAQEEKPRVAMFSNLTDLSFTRNFKQAVGFYIAYLILIAITAALLGGLFSLVAGNNSFDDGVNVGIYLAVIFSVIISFSILYKKKLIGNFVYLIIAITSGVLALFGGGLLGLIPAAYLSTR
ncbi:hypothetical protein IH981_01630 [Patescibacteria group bacterium]|nr:hypothetical protein [Patescibacteria group bacterium]